MRLSNTETDSSSPVVSIKEETVFRIAEAEMYPVESAELIHGPLPQEQGYIQATVLRTLLQLMLLLQSPAAQSKSVQTDLSDVMVQLSQASHQPKLIQELLRALGSDQEPLWSRESRRQPP